MKKAILAIMITISVFGYLFYSLLKDGKVIGEIVSDYKRVLIEDSLNVTITSILDLRQYGCRIGGDDIYISTQREKLFLPTLSINGAKGIFFFASTGDIIQKKMNNDTIMVIKRNSEMVNVYQLQELSNDSTIFDFLIKNI